MNAASWSSATFISDLHLEQGRPDILGALFYFLEEIAPEHPALFILGDLFEVWLGDDATDDIADQVAQKLSELANKGTTIYLMHGNRDFLIGEDYAKRCEAKLIQEPFILNLPDGDETSSIMLMHGDALCTDDVEYLKFRDMVRNPQWQEQFLSQSIPDRIAFAKQARAQSKEDTQSKSMEIMDVNQQAVSECLQRHQVTTLLHGHTHRPNSHEIGHKGSSDGSEKALRVVLGDWDKQGWYAIADPTSIQLTEFKFPITTS